VLFLVLNFKINVYYSNHLAPTIVHTSHTTYLKDGRGIMDIKGHMMYIVYSLIFLLLFFLAQLPNDYQVEVDTDLIVQAITFVDEDGHRIFVPEWVLGPGKRKAHSAENNEEAKAHGYSSWGSARAEAAQKWNAHYERYSSALPVVQVDGALKAMNDNHEAITDGEGFMRNYSAGFRGAYKNEF